MPEIPSSLDATSDDSLSSFKSKFNSLLAALRAVTVIPMMIMFNVLLAATLAVGTASAASVSSQTLNSIPGSSNVVTSVSLDGLATVDQVADVNTNAEFAVRSGQASYASNAGVADSSGYASTSDRATILDDGDRAVSVSQIYGLIGAFDSWTNRPWADDNFVMTQIGIAEADMTAAIGRATKDAIAFTIAAVTNVTGYVWHFSNSVFAIDIGDVSWSGLDPSDTTAGQANFRVYSQYGTNSASCRVGEFYTTTLGGGQAQKLKFTMPGIDNPR